MKSVNFWYQKIEKMELEDFMKEKHYKYVYEGFKMNNHYEESEIEDWWPIGANSIIVQMRDGTKLEYHHMLKTLRQVPEYNGSEEEWRREFSRRLSFEMYERGFDQTYLAEKSGISQVSISNYIKRKTTPSAYAVDRMARALGCYMDDLLPPFELE